MNCPHCLVIELDASGSCPRCGYRAAEESRESGRDGSPSPDGADADAAGAAPASGEVAPAPDADTAGPESAGEEVVPGWRKELSERLRAIKMKKEAHVAPARSTAASPEPAGGDSPDAAAAALRAEIMERMKTRKPAPRPPVPVPLQKKLEPLKAVPPAARPAPADPRRIQSLIDSAVSRKPVAAPAAAPSPVPPAVAPPATEHAAPGEWGATDAEGKLILLSRTLSGLVDLICIVVCAGIFVVAADAFSGILVLDAVSFVHFAVLFLLTYFVYSVFFLTSSSQTIGMMITDLRVEGMDGERPSLGQLLGRCGGHLVSLFGLGLGLLWGLMNRDNLCLHDRISGTRVVRS